MLLRLVLDATRGLAFLHAHNVVHRDVKSPNILVSNEFVGKMAELGLSESARSLGRRSRGTFTQQSPAHGDPSPMWASPEALRYERQTSAADVFSLCSVMYECIVAGLPFSNGTVHQLCFAVAQEGLRPDRGRLDRAMTSRTSGSALEKVVELMERGWQEQPEERPSCSDILNALGTTIATAPFTLPRRRSHSDHAQHTEAHAKREYETDFAELELGEELSEGAYSKVWCARFRVRDNSQGDDPFLHDVVAPLSSPPPHPP